MIKKTISVLLLITIIFTFSSCDKFTKKAYSVAYDISSEPRNLDPQTAADVESLTVINNIFEGLFYIDEQGEIKNGMAKTMTVSDNGHSYTIELIDNAAWANGDPLTASDFVFAFKRLLRPDTNSPAASQFFCIKNARAVNNGNAQEDILGVKALSDKTLLFELEYENENFQNLLTSTYAMPCNASFFTETKGKYGLEQDKIKSNGPFELTSWKHNESIRLKKNENYHDVLNVKPDWVSLFIKVEGETFDRMSDKQIDAAIVKGNEIEQYIKKGYNLEPIENETWGLYLNTKNNFLANKKIRTAISTCFDRSLYKDKLQTNLSVATGLMPHGIMLFNKSFREYAGENVTASYDPTLAYEQYKEGLAELDQSEVPVLNLLINKTVAEEMNISEYFSYPSQTLQKELALFINIEEVEEIDYNLRLSSGDFDIALYKLFSVDNSATSIFSRFKSESDKNFVSYNNEEYDTLVDDTNAQTQKQKIISGYVAAEKMLADDAVFIPMFYSTDYFVTSKNTKGIVRNKQTGLLNFKSAVI